MQSHLYTDSFLPNGYYHLFNHAVGNENLFRNEGNYQYFLLKFGQFVEPVCKIYAYCLMPNHFHFLIQIKSEAEIISFKYPHENAINIDFHKIVMQQFSNMLNGYAQAYNKMHMRKGALFIDYIKRRQILEQSYFTKLVHYIHHNPVHHNFCKQMEDWKYSSYKAVISDKPTRMEREDVLGWFGGIQQFKEQHLLPIDLTNEIEMS